MPKDVMRRAVVPLCAFVVAGCGGDSVAPEPPAPPASVAVVSGASQTADIGVAFAQPLIVKVLDTKGGPAKSASVTFEVTSGSATVNPTVATSDALGIAQTSVTAGGTGGEIIITARVTGVVQGATAALSARLPFALLAGEWAGTTSQKLPIYFRLTAAGVIDSLSLRVSGNIGIGTCTATMTAKGIQLQPSGKFEAPIAAFSLWSTKVIGAFAPGADASGTFDNLVTQPVIICGSTLLIGSSGLTLPGGTWTARRR
jgi:hypothetical protein